MLKNNTFIIFTLAFISISAYSQNITEKGIATVELGEIHMS